MRSLVAGLLALALAQSYPPPFPRQNATKLLETDRLVVWDIVWPKGQPTAMHRHVYDQVGTYYQRGGRVITTSDGERRQAMTDVGNLSTTLRNTLHIEEGTTDPPLRAVFIEMKMDTASGMSEAASDIPPAFPRDGAKPLLDNDRVTVWDYTLTHGRDTSLRRETRDAVIVWLSGGTLRSTPKGGTPVVVDLVAGKMQYRARGTVISDEPIEGSPRAYVFEFK